MTARNSSFNQFKAHLVTIIETIEKNSANLKTEAQYFDGEIKNIIQCGRSSPPVTL